jgi:hypothetical protein
MKFIQSAAGKPEKERQLGTSGHRWDIKLHNTEIGGDTVIVLTINLAMGR